MTTHRAIPRHSPVTTDLLAVAGTAEKAGDLAAARAAYEAVAGNANGSLAAAAKFHLGRIAWQQGRLDEAMAHYAEAREQAVLARNSDVRARAENGIGAVHFARGEYAQARASYALALELADDPGLHGKILLNLGVLAALQGEPDVARTFYHRSRERFARGGDEAGAAMVMHNLGLLHADRGEWEEANEAYRACLEFSERLGDHQRIANVLLNHCEVLRATGDVAAALAQAERALALHTEIGNEIGRGEALRWTGALLRSLDRAGHARAEHLLAEAIRIATRHRANLLHAEAARELGELKLSRGDRTGALQWLERARASFAELGGSVELDAVTQRLTEL